MISSGSTSLQGFVVQCRFKDMSGSVGSNEYYRLHIKIK